MLYSQNQKRTKTTQQKLLLNVSKKKHITTTIWLQWWRPLTVMNAFDSDECIWQLWKHLTVMKAFYSVDSPLCRAFRTLPLRYQACSQLLSVVTLISRSAVPVAQCQQAPSCENQITHKPSRYWSRSTRKIVNKLYSLMIENYLLASTFYTK